MSDGSRLSTLTGVSLLTKPQPGFLVAHWIFSWQRAHNSLMVDNKESNRASRSVLPNGRE